MAQVDYSALDDPNISMNSFFPRQGWTPTPEGVQDYTVNVGDDIGLSCRFFSYGNSAPTILFFYGNGETAIDYNSIAPFYNQIGLNFFVADYRGYGKSGGSPSFTTMLSDANTVLEAMRIVLGASGYQGPVYVMGRSMGRHSAFELAAKEDPAINGVIIESGRPSLGQFTGGLVPQQADELEEAYRAKAASIAIPVLVIHGEMDALAPLDDAEEMFRNFASTEKKMLVIPGAGHNDLLFKGLDEYFTAIGDFIFG
ncbi:MAG: alpha/beta hydrolase [SAR202 cluster bacterium]|nr:alpha/beta hydrolase [Chloroflexota bacterium]MBC52191.1 alpha/beta hydrolase [Chloroflexota bacterium]MBU17259.1 alpha/beta hydrolase [Chloroflexota bacterium]MQG49174.1 alpha/beta hydrolase [SAR202 cluster bacterium]MQG79426.1 alpha/beta hydrolase [SAR202 cluster bacterium]